MKILLQDQKTRLLAKADGQWVPNEEEATDFKTTLEAMNFCYLHHLSDISLVISSEGNTHEMPLRCDEE